jgi:hypothetical protein
MSFSLKNYAPEDVLMVFAGIPISNGLSDGTFVEIEPMANMFEDVVGADGEVTRTKTNDRRATVRFRLKASSSDNLKMSIIANLDKKTGGGIGPLMITVKGTAIVYAAAKAWIAKEPTVAFGAGPMEDMEWEIRCASLDVRLDAGFSDA